MRAGNGRPFHFLHLLRYFTRERKKTKGKQTRNINRPRRLRVYEYMHARTHATLVVCQVSQQTQVSSSFLQNNRFVTIPSLLRAETPARTVCLSIDLSRGLSLCIGQPLYRTAGMSVEIAFPILIAMTTRRARDIILSYEKSRSEDSVWKFRS